MTITPLGIDPALCFIGGRWVPAQGADTLDLINPSDGSTLCAIARGRAADIDAAVAAAQAALQGDWGRSTALERSRVLYRIGQLVLEQADVLADLEARDVGKPLKQARADAVALARYMEFYAGAADKVHGATIPYMEGYTVYTLREPHGVTGHIIPWNYPMQIIGRSVGAALGYGQCCCAETGRRGVPDSPRLCGDCAASGPARWRAECRTRTGGGGRRGSERSCGCASYLLYRVGGCGETDSGRNRRACGPVTLELGGKSPQVVFEDADIDAALPYLVNAGIQNAGQTCSASSRILVQRGVYDQVVTAMANRYDSLRVGQLCKILTWVQ